MSTLLLLLLLLTMLQLAVCAPTGGPCRCVAMGVANGNYCKKWGPSDQFSWCYLGGGVKASRCPGAHLSPSGNYWTKHKDICTPEIKFIGAQWSNPVPGIQLVYKNTKFVLDCSTNDPTDTVEIVYPNEKAKALGQDKVESLTSQKFELLVWAYRQAGVYSCKATRGAATATFKLGGLIVKPAKVDVVPAIWPKSPRPMLFGLHEKTNQWLYCIAKQGVEGPDVNLKWYKIVNGAKEAIKLNDITNPRFRVTSDSSTDRLQPNGKVYDKIFLSFLNFGKEDEGEYLCERDDGAAESKITSESVTIKLKNMT